MKKLIIVSVVSFVIVVVAACGGNDSKETKKDNSADLSENPDYQKGFAIIAKSDCLTCHEIDALKTGPPYRDVANKYAGMPGIVDSLAKKIISGGTGVWGQIPMLPHASLSMDDARAAVKYILLLKK